MPSASALTAALLAPYAVRVPRMPRIEATDEMSTRCPAPCERNSSIAASHCAWAPRTLVSRVARLAHALPVPIEAPLPMPALTITRSRPPSRSASSGSAVATESGSSTSIPEVTTRMPGWAARSSFCSDWSRSVRRAARARSRPIAANRRAMPSPRPELAPEMKMRWRTGCGTGSACRSPPRRRASVGRRRWTSSRATTSIRLRDDQFPTIGPARLRFHQPAGWVRACPGPRLGGMTTDTAVLPPMTTSAPTALPRRGWFRQLGVDTGYALIGFPIATAAFVVVVTGLALGAGLLVVWVGVAVLAATLLAARGFASAERAWLPAVLGGPVPRPAYLPPEGSKLRRLLTPLRDPQTWLDALHAVVRFPVAIFSFVVTVTL